MWRDWEEVQLSSCKWLAWTKGELYGGDAWRLYRRHQPTADAGPRLGSFFGACWAPAICRLQGTGSNLMYFVKRRKMRQAFCFFVAPCRRVSVNPKNTIHNVLCHQALSVPLLRSSCIGSSWSRSNQFAASLTTCSMINEMLWSSLAGTLQKSLIQFPAIPYTTLPIAKFVNLVFDWQNCKDPNDLGVAFLVWWIWWSMGTCFVICFQSVPDQCFSCVFPCFYSPNQGSCSGMWDDPPIQMRTLFKFEAKPF